MHPNQVSNVFAYFASGLNGDKFTFTAQGKESRFTYKIFRPQFENGRPDNLMFVKLLTGPDNNSSYTYIGTLVRLHGKWEYRHSGKGGISPAATSVKAFEYIFSRTMKELPLHQDVEIWHNGKCAKCGHKLTVPESIKSGIGPKCATF